jgi:hypothetical protein
MITPMTGSFVNYMSIVMILFIVYNKMITSGKYWYLYIPDIVSFDVKGSL